MKKTFPLHVAGKADARVVDAIKHAVRKYVKRERRKPLPEGFETWNFACKVGASAAAATACELERISGAVDAVAGAGGDGVYVEVIASPALRRTPAPGPAVPTNPAVPPTAP
jgi:hypothetical protein